jgi:transcriptional antiterminator NusG
VNSEGVVEVIDDERCHLTVQVQIFNRSTPVDLEFWQVESL